MLMMWNPARPTSLAPPEGGVAADFPEPRVTLSVSSPGKHQRDQLLVSLGVLVALVWVLGWYRGTALAMEDIWDRSGTFAHGYLIAPISIWLVWRKWEVLRTTPLAPSLWGLVMSLLSGCAWLTAELASVDSLAQFALVAMLISVVWALAGTAVARILAFPLGFLFFSVPFGEFLFPTMMDATARFTIAALRLSGVPVYAEGLSLIIPSGRWQVVEECSGVRYLIASVVVGSLYAYLNYRSISRRLVFVAVAVVVPILANWLRAYGIVTLGHLSNNRLATGVDHIVYGWVFFGLVVLGLFWIGARWRGDEPAPQPAPGGRAAESQPVLSLSAWAVVLILVTGILPLWTSVLDWLNTGGPKGAVTLDRPAATAGWTPADNAILPGWSPDYHGMSAEARSAWTRDAATVGLYVGYYRDQTPGRELINSENKIIRSKDPAWAMVSSGERLARLPEGEAEVGVTEIRDTRGGRMLVWHWYWIGGRVTSNAYVAKALTLLTKLTQRQDDSAVVVVFTPLKEQGRDDAEASLAAFVQQMGPALSQTLSAAAAGAARQ
jgi:exosortase A